MMLASELLGRVNQPWRTLDPLEVLELRLLLVAIHRTMEGGLGIEALCLLVEGRSLVHFVLLTRMLWELLLLLRGI